MVESDFEDDIEKSLLKSGYEKRQTSDYDSRLGLDKELILRFLQDTQQEELDNLEKKIGTNLNQTIIDAIYAEVNSRSLLDVIRKGIKINNEE